MSLLPTGRRAPAPRSGIATTVAATLVATVVAACASADQVAAPSPAAAPRAAVAAALPAVRFSEIHYDNDGTDAGERIEIAGPAGTDLTGWRIVLYNGSNGAVYEPTRTLAGTIPNQCDGRGVVVVDYPVNGLQNGSPDGMALVDASDAVVEFLSYEGSFAAVGGPASGMTSTDIGAAEGASTPLTHSLQRDDAGAWSGPKENSFGGCNGAGGGVPGVVVQVTSTAATVTVGSTVSLTAAATRGGAAVTPEAIAWSVAPAGRVAFAPATGSPTVATAVSAGTATVTATVTVDGQTYTGSTQLTVTQPATGLTVEGYSFRGSDPLPVGFAELYRVKDPGTNQFLRSGIEWSVSDAAIATVDARGNVTARGVGQVTITATETGTGRTGSIGLTTTTVAWSDTSVYADELQFGTPTDATPGDEQLVNRPTFAASWNAARGQPNWVAYNLDASHRLALADRCDCFVMDPQLPAGLPEITSADYDGSGFSRGHMAMSADRTRGALDNATTFYFSNIIPQTNQNNGGPWLGLEQYLGDQARNANKEVFIVAGGAAHDGTLNGAGRVAIPRYTWKVAVLLDRDRGLADVRSASDVRVIAVAIPNTTTIPQRTADWPLYQVTVDSVERLTGYDVLSALPDGLEALLEAQPPTTRALAMDVQPARISLASTPVVNVVLLSGVDFDAAAVRAGDVRLVVGGAAEGVAPISRNGVVNTAVRDVDGDGRPDRVIGFATSALRQRGLAVGPAALTLRPAAGAAWQATDPTPATIVR